MKNKLISILNIVVLIVLSSCSVSSDPTMEKKFIGKWVAEITESDDSEGEYIQTRVTIVCTYKRDNTFEQEFNCEILEPVYAYALSGKMSGTWKASKEELYEKIDLKSIKLIPNDELDLDEMISEMKKELEEDDGPDQILNISKSSFTLYNEKEHQRIRFYRVEEEKYNEEYVDEVAEPIEDPYLNEHSNDSDVASNHIELPSWIPNDAIEALGMGNNYTMRSSEVIENTFLKSSDVNLLEANSFEGYINEYTVKVTMKIDRDGNVSGRYAYESTLNRYGDNPKSWFPIKGVIVFDSNSSPYLFFQDRNPADDKIFEYALLKYNGGDSWSGNMINVKYLTAPESHHLHNIRFGLQ